MKDNSSCALFPFFGKYGALLGCLDTTVDKYVEKLSGGGCGGPSGGFGGPGGGFRYSTSRGKHYCY